MRTAWPGHQHSHADGLMRRLPAVVKLGIALALIVGTVLAPPGWTGWFAGVAAVLLAAIFLSRIPPLFLLKRLLLLSPFVLGVALVNASPTGGARQWHGGGGARARCVCSPSFWCQTPRRLARSYACLRP